MNKEEIKAIRNHLDETQAIFARRLRVTSTTISRWECGKASPDLINRMKLRRLAATYGLLLEVPDGNASPS